MLAARREPPMIVDTLEALEALYTPAPAPASTVKVADRITPHYRALIEASPFLALATAGPEGLDCSPRGDQPGFVRVQDERTLILPDRRGNNRIDSLRNVVRDPRVALMFLIPGSNTAMRINGRAIVAIEPTLLERFEMDGRHPRSVLVVTIDEIYCQCARALIRSDLWNPTKFVDVKSLPTVGDMMKEINDGFDGAAYDRDWPGRAAKTMW
jgi:PPOX class probable FMN-dependent enzyme